MEIGNAFSEFSSEITPEYRNLEYTNKEKITDFKQYNLYIYIS